MKSIPGIHTENSHYPDLLHEVCDCDIDECCAVVSSFIDYCKSSPGHNFITSIFVEKPPNQACDHCRRRKIKCNGENPCDKCQKRNFQCSYTEILRRKGPKLRTPCRSASLIPLASQLSPIHHFDYHHHHHQADGYNLSFANCCRTSLPRDYPPRDAQPLSNSIDSKHNLRSCQISLPQPKRLPSMVLLAHANVYLKYLYPSMPVISSEQILKDCHEPDKLNNQRYAFIVAVCAVTHIQLKLDAANNTLPMPVSPRSLISSEELLAEVTRTRKLCELSENATLDSLLTSFFLFVAYRNLGRQDQAWFYLCQTTSATYTLELHRDATYSKLKAAEAEEHRRVFWMLFLMERAYALQQARPITLRHLVHKPKALFPDDTVLEHGFIHLIRIFERLPPELYDFVASQRGEGSPSMSPTNNPGHYPKNISVETMVSIQQVDVLGTQQWLQVIFLKLSMSGLSHSNDIDTSSPLHLPVIVGKALIDVVGSLSPASFDVHNSSMWDDEQKPNGTDAPLAHATGKPNIDPTKQLSKMVGNPKVLLWGILNIPNRIRGFQF